MRNVKSLILNNTPSAAIVAITIKYAFSPDNFKATIPKVKELLRRLSNDEQAL